MPVERAYGAPRPCVGRALDARVVQHIAALVLPDATADDAVLVRVLAAGDGRVDRDKNALHRRQVFLSHAGCVDHGAGPERARHVVQDLRV